jgi:hypothetical protein
MMKQAKQDDKMEHMKPWSQVRGFVELAQDGVQYRDFEIKVNNLRVS